MSRIRSNRKRLPNPGPPTRIRRIIGVCLLALLSVITSVWLRGAAADTVRWDGQEDDNWHLGINWDKLFCIGSTCAFFYPEPDDDAVLSNTSFGFLSEFSQNTVVRSVTISNDIVVDTNGFQLNSGARNTQSSSRIQIIGGNSRLLVDGGGGPDPDLVTNRFEIFGNGGVLQLRDASATITSASGKSTIAPGSKMRGSGTVTFNNTSGVQQVTFENAGTIEVLGGDLTIRAENGARLDLDGALGNDGILDVDDAGGSRMLRVEGPLSAPLDGPIYIGQGDAAEFELPWQLGRFDEPGNAGSARLRMRGGAGTAALMGADVTVQGSDTNIDVETGTALFGVNLDFSLGTLTINDDTTARFGGDLDFHSGTFTIGHRSTVEFLGDVEIGPAAQINTGIFVWYDLFVAGNTVIHANFDWDGGALDHTTTIQGGSLRILSDEIDDDNAFGGVVHVISQPGRPAILEVSTATPWVLNREMYLDASADVARLEGATLLVGIDSPIFEAVPIHVTGSHAEIAAQLVMRQDAKIVTDPTTTLRLTNPAISFIAEPGSEFLGGGTIRNEGIALVAGDITMEVDFVNAGTFNLFGDGALTDQLTLQGFEQTTTGTLNIELGGTVAGDEYDQLIVTGNTTLDGDLNLALGFTPTTGDSFVIIDASTPVMGTFAGLAEGAMVGKFGGVNLFITYVGGDGHDVTLYSGLPGDFDNNGFYECADVDGLVAEIAAGTHRALYDLTADGFVDINDLDQWRALGGAANLPSGDPYLVGDATLDGTVDGLDFIRWNANKFTLVAAWCSGDFNADGVVGGLDFILWNANKFTSADSNSVVPEPSAGVLGALGLVWLVLSAQRRPSREST